MPRRSSVVGGVSLAVLSAALGACAVATPSSVPAAASGGSNDAAAAYCVEQGGTVVTRVPTWNTNGDPSTWLPLTGSLDLCEFESGEGDEATRISVDLRTLYAETPTLAAVAYLSKVVPPRPPEVGMNPGSYDCSVGLAGSGDFGTTAAGGGWVDPEQPVFTVMNLCVFPDMSTIDEFGIYYYATGAVRGADLAPLFRYQPGDELPAIFDPRPGVRP